MQAARIGTSRVEEANFLLLNDAKIEPLSILQILVHSDGVRTMRLAHVHGVESNSEAIL